MACRPPFFFICCLLSLHSIILFIKEGNLFAENEANLCCTHRKWSQPWVYKKKSTIYVVLWVNMEAHLVWTKKPTWVCLLPLVDQAKLNKSLLFLSFFFFSLLYFPEGRRRVYTYLKQIGGVRGSTILKHFPPNTSYNNVEHPCVLLSPH